MIIHRSATCEWSETGLDGIQTCATWNGEDGDGGYFARFRAGAYFPKHRHQGWEQVVVLSGAIQFNDVVLRAGDGLQAQGIDEHDAQALEETLLFVSHRRGITFIEIS